MPILEFIKKKLLNKKGFSNWKIIPASHLNKTKPYIQDLYDRKIDGYIIKNVISNAEVQEMIQAFEYLDKNREVHFHGREGYINPRAFAQIQNNNEFDEGLLQSYLEDAEWLSSFLKNKLSFDIETRIKKTLSEMQCSIPVSVPYCEVKGEKKTFTFATYRFLKVSAGGMHIHCGSMFRKIYPNFYKRIDQIVNFEGQLSYFLMLQRPSKGGQLRLFDAEWKKYKKHNDGIGFYDSNNTIKSMESTAFQDIDPMPGDLLIFVGGDIWHEVTSPTEGLPRITFGGFLAYGNNRSNIYVWS